MRNRVIFSLLIIVLFALPLFAACAKAAPAPTTSPTSAPSAQTFNLKYSGFLPEMAGPSKVANFLMDYVEKNTGGRVKFERFHGGTLAGPPEQQKLVETGAVDLGGGNFVDADFPMHASFPTFVMGGVKAGSDFQSKLYSEIPETSAILQKEMTDRNVKYLGPTNSSENGYIAKFNFKTLADLKGKKIGCDSGRVQTVLDGLGMVGVVVQIPDMYEALARGLVDGATLSLIGMQEMKWYETTKCYMSDGESMAGNTMPLVNLNTWNKLPPDIQKVFLDAAGPTSEYCVKVFEEGNVLSRKVLTDAGLTVGDLPKAEQELLYKAYVDKWYKDSTEIATKQGKAEQAKILWKYSSEILGLTLPK